MTSPKEKVKLPYRTGQKGLNRVRLHRKPKDELLYLEWYPQGGRRARKAHSQELAEAVAEAHTLSAEILKGLPSSGDSVTLGQLFDRYQVEVTPHKGSSKKAHDMRTLPMLGRYFGRDMPAADLTRRHWDAFIRDRRAGKIPGFGPVRDRQIEYDLKALRAVLRWAEGERDMRTKQFLLDRDPTRNLEIPKEKSPRRVRVLEPEYQALAAAAPKVDWRFGTALALTHETGRRIGAVRRLQWDDVDWKEGRIRWRAEYDKMRREEVIPVTESVLEALKEARRSYGGISRWVFPSPKDPSLPTRGDFMTKLWNRAIRHAGLPPKRQRGWHSFRRKFATDMKHQPAAETMALGGWSSPAMLSLYTQTDEKAQRKALEARQRAS